MYTSGKRPQRPHGPEARMDAWGTLGTQTSPSVPRTPDRPQGVVFVVPRPPVAKARARVVRTPSGAVRTYTPDKTHSFELDVAACARQAIPAPLEGPVRVDVVAILPRPQRLMRRKDRDGLVWAPTRPDKDNVEKAVMEGLAGVLRDDAQVCYGGTRKVYAGKAGQTLVVVRVLQLADEDVAMVEDELAEWGVKVGGRCGEPVLEPTRPHWHTP